MATYNINDILRAITNKDSYEDKAGITGNCSWVDIVIDAENIVKAAKLTARQQQVFDMYYVQDMTSSSIAAELSISHQGVSDCLAQCKKKIQAVLNSMEVD